MSMLNTAYSKQPYKLIEVPLNKFSEEVIPHHQKIFEEHKILVLKYISINNINQANKEINNKKRFIKQLKDLTYELDTLRAQVEHNELDKFDNKTLSLRKIILNLINGYLSLEKISTLNNKIVIQSDISKDNPFEGASQIQLQDNIDELNLHEEIFENVENLNRDIEDLHGIYTHLNEIVHEQGSTIENINENIENTGKNIETGVKHIIKAHKYKVTAYPVTGAFLGGIVGGPIGLIAGAKIGSLVALGCAAVGYTGGLMFKNIHNSQHNVTNENKINEINPSDDSNNRKKDI